ncbi:hypothetical protein TgHK011_005678 [Trichoderma gracile]|nr:hypothetical protein TgHK011_005678 [Trichoderma gracile]
MTDSAKGRGRGEASSSRNSAQRESMWSFRRLLLPLTFIRRCGDGTPCSWDTTLSWLARRTTHGHAVAMAAASRSQQRQIENPLAMTIYLMHAFIIQGCSATLADVLDWSIRRDQRPSRAESGGSESALLNREPHNQLWSGLLANECHMSSPEQLLG